MSLSTTGSRVRLSPLRLYLIGLAGFIAVSAAIFLLAPMLRLAHHGPDLENPPLYVGAQQTAVAAQTGLGYLTPYRTITYKAAARQQAVLDFYKDAMPKQGWTAQDETDVYGAGSLSFIYSEETGQSGGAIDRVLVLTAVRPDDSTGVTVEMYRVAP
ncbi:MAG: hypothetical protein M3014_13275 [Chloroflexota bacterium]|nr:hypothetical protein [Chloroflexota bacterium]